jgi:hypothetical protein
MTHSRITTRVPFGFCQLLLLLNAVTPAAIAQQPGGGVRIEKCAVYSELDKSKVFDCAENARAACPEAAICELPIGMNLTNGRDLDDNEQTWELVKVEFSCGTRIKFNGPHYQNNHATMTLACPPH